MMKFQGTLVPKKAAGQTHRDLERQRALPAAGSREAWLEGSSWRGPDCVVWDLGQGVSEVEAAPGRSSGQEIQ